MRKSIAFFSTVMLVVLLSALSVFAFDSKDEGEANISQIDKFPKNSIERYAYSKAVTNHTSFKDELKKAKTDVVPLSNDEYVTYRTKGSKATGISTNRGVLNSYIYTEAKVVVNRLTGRATRVIDFGAPYASISSYSSEWRGGGFNINRVSDTSARFSTTGQFIIHGPGFTVGYSIISVTANTGAVTEVMTLSTTIKW